MLLCGYYGEHNLGDDALLNSAAEQAPTHMLATIDDVGAYAAFLASREAANVTGGIHLIDGGYSIVG